LALTLAAGCRGSHPGPELSQTGAEEVARDYAAAIVRRDWQAAYDGLSGATQAAFSRDKLARAAENFYRNIGFEPSEVDVQSCQERNNEAVAHLVYRCQSGSSTRYCKDTIALRRDGSGWAVILPSNFGTLRSRKK
jgi:hypothetical protein